MPPATEPKITHAPTAPPPPPPEKRPVAHTPTEKSLSATILETCHLCRVHVKRAGRNEPTIRVWSALHDALRRVHEHELGVDVPKSHRLDR